MQAKGQEMIFFLSVSFQFDQLRLVVHQCACVHCSLRSCSLHEVRTCPVQEASNAQALFASTRKTGLSAAIHAPEWLPTAIANGMRAKADANDNSVLTNETVCAFVIRRSLFLNKQS